jgi:hypothetical protein
MKGVHCDNRNNDDGFDWQKMGEAIEIYDET